MKLGIFLKQWPLVLSAFLTVSCGPSGLQREDQFAWAIREGAGSTSPPIVRVRLSNGQNGTGSIRCVFSDTLVEAIMTELGVPQTEAGYERAISFALASRDHNFRFIRPASWKVISAGRGIMTAELAKGCELIQQGHSALWADMQAKVIMGPQFPNTGSAR